MKKVDLKQFVGITIFSAIILTMGLVPYIGFIQLPFLAIGVTTLLIPVIVGTVLYDLKGGMILGLVFGLSSLFVALTRPSSPFDIAFQNPFVSVLPRVLFPVIFYYLFKLSQKFSQVVLGILLTVLLSIFAVVFYKLNDNFQMVIVAVILIIVSISFTIFSQVKKTAKTEYILPTFLSCICHSFMVLSMIGFFYSDLLSATGDNVFTVILIIVFTNSAIEASFTAFIIQLVMPTIRRFKHE